MSDERLSRERRATFGERSAEERASGPPNFNYSAGGNPYFNQKQVVDPIGCAITMR